MTPALPLSPCPPVPQTLQQRFLTCLPRIEQHAHVFFRHIHCANRKADAIAETTAMAWKWFVRLTQRGKDPLAFVSVLASYAARAVQDGRHLCGMEKAKDVLSPQAQRHHGFRVESLPCSTRMPLGQTMHAGPELKATLEERLIDNTRTPPDEQAMFRIDFPAWLQTLTPRERRLIGAMARNERTRDLRGASMDRRRLLQVLGVTALGLTASGEAAARDDEKAGERQPPEHVDKCAQACAACANHFNSCFHHCATLVGEGKKEHTASMELCVDCAELCMASAQLVSRHSPLAVIACEACAKACDTCAGSCEKFPDDEHLKTCGKSCRDCAAACREMIKHVGH